MDESSIIIHDDGEKTTILIDWGKNPKKDIEEKREKCPRCGGKTLIDTELGGQYCTVCGWPDKEDARKRARERKKALINKN